MKDKNAEGNLLQTSLPLVLKERLVQGSHTLSLWAHTVAGSVLSISYQR